MHVFMSLIFYSLIMKDVKLTNYGYYSLNDTLKVAVAQICNELYVCNFTML